MKRLIMICVCLLCLHNAFSQLQASNINDSTFIYEDTATKTEIPLTATYPLRIIFMGRFFRDSISLYYNGRKILHRIISTINEAGTKSFSYTSPSLILQINQRRKSSIKLVINKTTIVTAIRYGYALLYISTSPDIINNKNKISYGFEFTNKEILDL